MMKFTEVKGQAQGYTAIKMDILNVLSQRQCSHLYLTTNPQKSPWWIIENCQNSFFTSKGHKWQSTDSHSSSQATPTTKMWTFSPNSKKVESDFKCLYVLMWLNPSVAFWIYSILEESEKQLAAFCAFYFNLEGGHLRSAIKKRFALAVMNWCNSQFKLIWEK